MTSQELPSAPSKALSSLLDSAKFQAIVFFKNFIKKTLGKRKVSKEVLEGTVFELLKVILNPATPKNFMQKLKPVLIQLLIGD